MELHVPSYNYVGPLTKMSERISGNYKGSTGKNITGDKYGFSIPVNKYDSIALKHDILYTYPQFRRIADNIMLKETNNVSSKYPKNEEPYVAKVINTFIGAQTATYLPGTPSEYSQLSDDDKKTFDRLVDTYDSFISSLNSAGITIGPVETVFDAKKYNIKTFEQISDTFLKKYNNNNIKTANMSSIKKNIDVLDRIKASPTTYLGSDYGGTKVNNFKDMPTGNDLLDFMKKIPGIEDSIIYKGSTTGNKVYSGIKSIPKRSKVASLAIMYGFLPEGDRKAFDSKDTKFSERLKILVDNKPMDDQGVPIFTEKQIMNIILDKDMGDILRIDDKMKKQRLDALYMFNDEEAKTITNIINKAYGSSSLSVGDAFGTRLTSVVKPESEEEEEDEDEDEDLWADDEDVQAERAQKEEEDDFLESFSDLKNLKDLGISKITQNQKTNLVKLVSLIDVSLKKRSVSDREKYMDLVKEYVQAITGPYDHEALNKIIEEMNSILSVGITNPVLLEKVSLKSHTPNESPNISVSGGSGMRRILYDTDSELGEIEKVVNEGVKSGDIDGGDKKEIMLSMSLYSRFKKTAGSDSADKIKGNKLRSDLNAKISGLSHLTGAQQRALFVELDKITPPATPPSTSTPASTAPPPIPPSTSTSTPAPAPAAIPAAIPAGAPPAAIPTSSGFTPTQIEQLIEGLGSRNEPRPEGFTTAELPYIGTNKEIEDLLPTETEQQQNIDYRMMFDYTYEGSEGAEGDLSNNYLKVANLIQKNRLISNLYKREVPTNPKDTSYFVLPGIKKYMQNMKNMKKIKRLPKIVFNDDVEVEPKNAFYPSTYPTFSLTGYHWNNNDRSLLTAYQP